MKGGVDDFLGLSPRFIVYDILQTQVRRFVLMVTGRGVVAVFGGGAAILADSDESEDIGTKDPAMDNITDVLLEGSLVVDEPCLVMRDPIEKTIGALPPLGSGQEDDRGGGGGRAHIVTLALER